MSDYAARYRNNISEDEGSEEDQLHTENKQDFKLVENRIDKIIKGARDEITILFCSKKALDRKESQSILIFLKQKTTPNIWARILFPFGTDDRLVDSYREVADVRIFDRKLENNDTIIVRDDIEVLVVSTTDPTQTYSIAYSDNEKIAYTYITNFEKLWLLQTVTKLEVRQTSFI
jgi:hypothetical protein